MSIRDNSYGIADLQEKMLDILKYFDGICMANQLTYWAGAGTCLGAIRHQGFIPWDDDLDVYMPRHDYEKLWAMRDSVFTDSKYRLCRTNRDTNYRHRVMQIVDTSTTFINQRCVNDDIEHGVYIDIIPMDAAATGKVSRLFQAFHTIMYSVYNIQIEPEFHGNHMMEIGTRFLLKAVKSQNRRFKIWAKAEKKMTRYDTRTATEYVDLLTYFKMIFKPMPAAWFRPIRVPFEDTTVNVPIEYDKYLTTFYGDYMQLPPEEKRAIQHNTVLVDLNRPYTEYKGIYFCKEAAVEGETDASV